MKAYIIAIENNDDSVEAAKRCIESSERYRNEFEIQAMQAVTPDDVDRKMRHYKVKWNYPWSGVEHDLGTGLVKSAYQTANREARIACAMSHYQLWHACAKEDDQPFLILEHDAIFKKQLNYNSVLKSSMEIIGINNPLFATRKSRDYLKQITVAKSDKYGVCLAPTIDDMSVPQGLAGNSAYLIKPSGAFKMIQLVAEYGLWPNDALMCKQLIMRLGVTKTFYTEVQRTRSTTTL